MLLYEQSIGISTDYTVCVWVCAQFHTHPARYQCALGMWGAEGDLTFSAVAMPTLV